MCDLEVIGSSSMFSVIRRVVALPNTRSGFGFVYLREERRALEVELATVGLRMLNS